MKERDLFDPDAVRSLLNQLFADSRFYTSGKDYKELFDFVVKLRNFAPFNAMLLQVQKPGFDSPLQHELNRFNGVRARRLQRHGRL